MAKHTFAVNDIYGKTFEFYIDWNEDEQVVNDILRLTIHYSYPSKRHPSEYKSRKLHQYTFNRLANWLNKYYGEEIASDFRTAQLEENY